MIVLQILKVIGIILLVLLIILLLLLAVILFAPIHYRADGSYKDTGNEYHVKVKVNWLLKIIRAFFVKNRSSTDIEAKVLWIKVYPRPEKSSGTLGERKAPEESGLGKIKYKIHALYVKIKRIIYMLNDERDKDAVLELLLRVKKLLWHIRPRKLDISLKLGLGDPAATGEALGCIYAFYPVYTRHLRLDPDFDNKVIESSLELKGHVQLIFVLIAALRVYFNKDIRRLYRQIQKLR